LENLIAIQQGYTITPMSVFMGEPPKSAPAVIGLPGIQQ